ncbi:unnamed protein product [Rangifer tarandus platyrhynchus]|uniref:Uncharacterized protein n=2 Tax=Rangifer tarandus platyrhynchus TaxID=3082113 RepID=A0AC59Z3X0_RANTA|nr:unnamed protein product [Rangifer tarandus platyrhynchus]
MDRGAWWATVPGGTKESENNIVTKHLVCCLGEDVKGTDRSQGEASPQPQLKEQATRAGWEGSLEPGVSRSFKGIDLGSAVRLNQGSDLGLADFGRQGFQHPLELCFTKALGLILSL